MSNSPDTVIHLVFLGSWSWPNYVGDMVWLTLVSEASLALSFDCEMDDKL